MIVVDTHVVAWLALDPEKLSEKAVDAIRAARREGGVGISDITLWELAMLVARQRIVLNTSLESFLQKVETTFVVFAITGEVAQRSALFQDPYPSDPADRIIGATALVQGVPLVTRDERIRGSNQVPVIW